MSMTEPDATTMGTEKCPCGCNYPDHFRTAPSAEPAPAPDEQAFGGNEEITEEDVAESQFPRQGERWPDKRTAGQPTAAPEGREPDGVIKVDSDEHVAMIVGPLVRDIYGDSVELGHYKLAIAAYKMAFSAAYSAGKTSGDAEPDWHAFYTDSQTKLYHADELLASAAEREQGLCVELARISVIAQTLHTLLHPAERMEECKLAPCDQFKNAAEYEKFVTDLIGLWLGAGASPQTQLPRRSLLKGRDPSQSERQFPRRVRDEAKRET